MGILEDGISGTTIQAGIDGVYTTILWIIILIAFSLIVYFVIDSMQYNILFRIRHMTNGVTIIRDTKIKEKKDKDGVKYWLVKGSLFKKSERIPIPKENAISVMSNGKKVVEAWQLPTGEYSFCIDEGPKLNSFKSFTVNQRLMYIDEIKKANEYGQTQWGHYIPIIASGMVLIIIFVIALTFWGDVVAPAQELQATNLEIAKTQSEIMTTLQELIQNKQIFKEEVPQ